MCQISIDLSEQGNTTHHSHILRVGPTQLQRTWRWRWLMTKIPDQMMI